MTRFIPHLMVAGALVAGLTAGPAFAQGRPLSPTTTSAVVAEKQSEQAALAGDWANATILAARSYRESPSIINEFNLAADYVQSGRAALAIPLYEDVAANGQFLEAKVVYDYRSGARPDRVQFNYGDEANRRIAELTGEPVAPDLR